MPTELRSTTFVRPAAFDVRSLSPQLLQLRQDLWRQLGLRRPQLAAKALDLRGLGSGATKLDQR